MKVLTWNLILIVLYHESCGDGILHPLSQTADNEISIKEKRAAGDPFTRRSAMDKNFIRFGRSSPNFHDPPNRSHKNHMSLARVSRATRDNFMRFGRSQLVNYDDHAIVDIDDFSRDSRANKDNFMRFGRKDNFMRFGRGKDNFMRFGRGKDNFMRFGRGKDNFMRFGRGKDNFMRFGRGKENFMRFGRGKDNFMRFGRGKDNFMRFGKSTGDFSSTNDIPSDPGAAELIFRKRDDVKTSFARYGKSPKKDDSFMRFGRGGDEAEPEEPKIDEDGREVEIGDLVLQADKPKNGPIIRNKRSTDATTLWEIEENSLNRASRDSELVEDVPAQSSRWKSGESIKRSPYALIVTPENELELVPEDYDGVADLVENSITRIS